jgi:hypothetical protein
MKALCTIAGLTVAALSIAAASPALGVTLANRVFVSQRSGNDSNPGRRLERDPHSRQGWSLGWRIPGSQRR